MYVVGSKIFGTNSWSNSWTGLIWIRNYLFVFRYMECMEFRDICMGYFKMVTVRQSGNKNWIECLGSRFKIIGMSIVDSESVILEVYRYYEFQSSANSDLNFRERRELREFLGWPRNVYCSARNSRISIHHECFSLLPRPFQIESMAEDEPWG